MSTYSIPWGVSSLGRAVILVSHASGFLRLCRRALHKLAWLTHIPLRQKYNIQRFYYYTINSWITQIHHKTTNMKQTSNRYKKTERCWVFPFLPSVIFKKGSWALVHLVQGYQNKLNGHLYCFGKTKTRVGRLVLLCYFLGSITRYNYRYRGLERGLPALTSWGSLSWAPYIPAGLTL